MPPQIPKIEMLESMIHKTASGCWLWIATRPSGRGYCYIKPGPKRLLAHRWVYEQLKGPLPVDIDLHHKMEICTSKTCVNPDHLDKVTDKTHPDTTAGINRTKTHCKRGHEFSTQNTYRTTQGSRGCLTCRRDYDRARA